MSQSQSNLVQGIRYGWACLLARSQTIILFQYLIISLRKKLYLSTHISRTIDWKPPNQAFVVFAAEELNLHLSPTIKSGNRVGLHLQLQSSLDSLCFDFIWNTSTGSTQSSKWVSPTLSMSAFTWQLLSWKMTPGNKFRVGNKTVTISFPYAYHTRTDPTFSSNKPLMSQWQHYDITYLWHHPYITMTSPHSTYDITLTYDFILLHYDVIDRTL